MGRALAIMALLAPMAVAGVASATVVDFGSLGAGTANITVPNTPLTIGDPFGLYMTLTYDNFGNPNDFAMVDSTGVFGTTGGALELSFTPSTTLSFDFTQLNATGPLANPLFISLFSGGADVADLSAGTTFDGATGNATGTFSYTGPVVDSAVMYYSMETSYFTANNMVYSPEPATMGFLALGLVGLARRRILGR